MNTPPITLAQIGCGYWGPNLLRNFHSLPNCRVKYVVEASTERRRFVQGAFPGIVVDAGLEQVLQDPEVSAIAVATPAGTHFELARQALRAGKHVFVEKPMAMSVAEVDELAALADAADRRLMVGHTFLYNPAVLYLKSLVDKGDLGQIYYAYSQRLNLGVIRKDVNAMWNLSPHDISIFCFLFGAEPLAVTAHGTAYIQPGIEDVVFMNLAFPNKIQAHIHVSWLDPQKTRRIVLVGSRKMAVYDDVADNKIAIYDKGFDQLSQDERIPFDIFGSYKLIQRSGDVLLPSISGKEPLKEEVKHFLDCIANGKRPLTDANNARQVVSVLERAQTALKRHAERLASGPASP